MNGRRCIVTGAASGIGRAIATAFAARGARVAGVDRNDAGLRGMPIAPVIADLGALGGPAAAIRKAEAALGGFDVLVNAAGISTIAPAAVASRAGIEEVLGVNLIAPMMLCAAVLPDMRAAGRGCIINVVSELALVAQHGFTTYCASKGGLLAYTRALALECAADGVQVNAICPGPVDTPMLRREFATTEDPEAERAATIAGIPIGRLGDANEIAQIALFLATAPGIMQGAVVVADGGKTLQ